MISGRTTIAPEVLITIARLTTLNVEGVSRLADDLPGVNRLFRKSPSSGVEIEIREGAVHANLYVVLKNDVNIREVGRNIQQQVQRAIAEMVGMPVGRINVHVTDIDYPKEPEA